MLKSVTVLCPAKDCEILSFMILEHWLIYLEHLLFRIPSQIRNSLKWNLTKERSCGEALIQRPLASRLYEAATHVK